ncbi:MAG: rhodanese-like domain-containing protein [Deltaproteobacteria bacterium]|nr:MAG: rhodanese-like domain-containing protein [Deltaproteobacteria bacterium]
MAVVAFCTAVPAALAATAANVNPRQAAALLKERADIYLLDVRTLQEYRQAHLADSNLIPIDQIERRLAEIPRNRPILVYCAVGSRSAQVFSYLARRGYPEVYNLDGGIVAWAQHGYPVSR